MGYFGAKACVDIQKKPDLWGSSGGGAPFAAFFATKPAGAEERGGDKSPHFSQSAREMGHPAFDTIALI
jgi:hypothetical protein